MSQRKRVRESDRNQIRQLLAHGRSVKQISQITGFSNATIYRVKYGVVQTKDGAVRTMDAPKPRKNESELVSPLPENVINKTETNNVACSNVHSNPEVTETIKEYEEVKTNLDINDVFVELVKMTDNEFKNIVRDAKRARRANAMYQARTRDIKYSISPKNSIA